MVALALVAWETNRQSVCRPWRHGIFGNVVICC